MADQVQIQLEDMLPELEQFIKWKAFSRKEVKEILRVRTKHEHRTRGRKPLKVDFMRYMAYEMDLLEGMRTRCAERQLGKKTGKLLGFITRRIHFLFDRVLIKYPGDEKILYQYHDFCARNGGGRAMDRVLGRAISCQPTNVRLWIMAAKWHYETNKDFGMARTLLQRALRVNKESRLLWTQYFRFELIYRETILARLELLPTPRSPGGEQGAEGDDILRVGTESGDDEADGDDGEDGVMKRAAPDLDPASNPFLRGAVCQIVLQQAFAALPEDIALREECYRIYLDFQNTSDLRESLRQSIRKEFSARPEGWALYAVLPWREIEWAREDEEEVTSEHEERALRDAKQGFEDGISQLSEGRELRTAYVRFLQGVLENSVVGPSCKETARKLLTNVLHEGSNAGELGEDAYLCWIGVAVSEREKKRAMSEGLVSFPGSDALWVTRLSPLLGKKLTAKSVEEADNLFNEALGMCGGPAVQELFYRYCELREVGWGEFWKRQSSHILARAEKGFLRSDGTGDWEHLAGLVLNVTLDYGVAAVRQMYGFVLELPCRPALGFLLSCAGAENSLMEGFPRDGHEMRECAKRVRNFYGRAETLYGGTDHSIWIAHMEWEEAQGALDERVAVYNRAIRALQNTTAFMQEVTFARTLRE
mmetsp:Transcript_6613/g.18684  ORF Transcript_6613/g.18684 Transcript_6613/m.18684 type:complete len:650 (-) Transcript_6613:33-1982(-)